MAPTFGELLSVRVIVPPEATPLGGVSAAQVRPCTCQFDAGAAQAFACEFWQNGMLKAVRLPLLQDHVALPMSGPTLSLISAICPGGSGCGGLSAKQVAVPEVQLAGGAAQKPPASAQLGVPTTLSEASLQA